MIFVVEIASRAGIRVCKEYDAPSFNAAASTPYTPSTAPSAVYCREAFGEGAAASARTGKVLEEVLAFGKRHAAKLVGSGHGSPQIRDRNSRTQVLFHRLAAPATAWPTSSGRRTAIFVQVAYTGRSDFQAA